MSDTFDENTAPYNNVATFVALWNEMTPDRRRNNTGLFYNALEREPTESEIEHGVDVETVFVADTNS